MHNLSHMKVTLTILVIYILFVSPIRSQTFTATGFDYSYQIGDDNTFDKPIIILEGFDIENSVTAQELYNDWESLVSILESNGYDIITLSYENPYKSMHDNSQHLKDLITEVNNKKTGNFELTLIGQSMGGVIIRMALTELENEGYDHQTGLYVSFDAPHKGANIPLGIQTFTDDLSEIDAVELLDFLVYDWFGFIVKVWSFGIVGLNNPFDSFLDALNSTASRELLIYHFKNHTNNLFSDMQDYLDNLGYPQKSKNIALINGNDRGDTLMFSSGNEGTNFWNKSWGNCNFAFRYALDIDVSGVNVTHDRVSEIKIKSFWPPPLWIPCIEWTDREGHGDFGAIFWDNAPGASFSFDSPIGGTGVKQFCFLPTVSSIDLTQSIIDAQGPGYFNVNNNITVQQLVENNETPFDNIYSNEINTNHVNVTWQLTEDKIRDIIQEQIMWDRMFLQNRTITNDRAFEAVSSITIGENVRNFAGQYNGEVGPFVIESGKISLLADEILIEAGFELKEGAELVID